MGACCSFCNCCPSCVWCGYRTRKDFSVHPLDRWFEFVAKNNPDLKLIDLKSIASHHSGIYSISSLKCCSSVSVNHEEDLYGQLKAGSRHLNFRYGVIDEKREDGFMVRHGPHFGAHYYAELGKVLEFVREHPHEFIILELSEEYGTVASQAQYRYFLDFVENMFKDWAIRNDDGWFDVKTTTVGQILARPKQRIFITLDNGVVERFKPDGNNPLDEVGYMKRGFFFHSKFVECRWPNRAHPQEVIDYNEEMYRDVRKNGGKQKIIIAQYVMTPQFSKKDIVRLIFGIQGIRVDQKVGEWHRSKLLHRSLRDACEFNEFGFCMMDFFTLEPYLLHFVIGLNIKEKLVIHQASVSNLSKEEFDVTFEVQGLIRCKNSLWIIDFKKDLEIRFSSGILCLCYTFVNEDQPKKEAILSREMKVEFIPFSSTSNYLLNGNRGKLDRSQDLLLAKDDPYINDLSAGTPVVSNFITDCTKRYIDKEGSLSAIKADDQEEEELNNGQF